MMRTNCTWWTRRRRNTLKYVHKRKHLNILSAPMSDPGATKSTTRHIHPSHDTMPYCVYW
jgi:hypothetical protein